MRRKEPAPLGPGPGWGLGLGLGLGLGHGGEGHHRLGSHFLCLLWQVQPVPPAQFD